MYWIFAICLNELFLFGLEGLKIKKPISPVLVGTIKEWIIFLHFSSQVCVRCKTSFLWWADLILVAKRAWRIVTHLTQWQKCGPAAHPSTSVCQFSFMFWNDFDICKTLNAWFPMYIVSRLCLGRHQAAVCELNGFVYVIGGAESWNCLKLSRALQPSKQHMDPGGPHERGSSWSWCGCVWR